MRLWQVNSKLALNAVTSKSYLTSLANKNVFFLNYCLRFRSLYLVLSRMLLSEKNLSLQRNIILSMVVKSFKYICTVITYLKRTLRKQHSIHQQLEKMLRTPCATRRYPVNKIKLGLDYYSEKKTWNIGTVLQG